MTPMQISKLVYDETGSRPEAFVDFLDSLAESAFETSEHLQTNWQDRDAAKQWMKIANAIVRASVYTKDNVPF
jgi:hypothetical protein